MNKYNNKSINITCNGLKFSPIIKFYRLSEYRKLPLICFPLQYFPHQSFKSFLSACFQSIFFIPLINRLDISSPTRVWKRSFGIRDLTKMQSEIREKAKYFDGIWGFTVLRQAGFAKIWARDVGIVFCSSGNRENITI